MNDERPPSPLGSNEKKFIPKSVETKVAGRKVIVTTAIALIAEASFVACSPILT